MFTSSLSHTDTNTASANLPLLRRDWLANAGTMLTVRAGYLTMCSSLAMLVSGVGCPSASANVLVDLCSIWMKGSHRIPSWDLHDVSQSTERIYTSSTPCLTCCSVSLYCWRFSVFFLCEIDVRLYGCYCHFVLSWSRLCWGRVKRTWWIGGWVVITWVVVTWRLHMCSSGSISSTWLVSGVY